MEHVCSCSGQNAPPHYLLVTFHGHYLFSGSAKDDGKTPVESFVKISFLLGLKLGHEGFVSLLARSIFWLSW